MDILEEYLKSYVVDELFKDRVPPRETNNRWFPKRVILNNIVAAMRRKNNVKNPAFEPVNEDSGW